MWNFDSVRVGSSSTLSSGQAPSSAGTGGDGASGTAMKDLWYYSVATGQWTLLTPASRTQSLYGRKLAALITVALEAKSPRQDTPAAA